MLAFLSSVALPTARSVTTAIVALPSLRVKRPPYWRAHLVNLFRACRGRAPHPPLLLVQILLEYRQVEKSLSHTSDGKPQQGKYLSLGDKTLAQGDVLHMCIARRKLVQVAHERQGVGPCSFDGSNENELPLALRTWRELPGGRPRYTLGNFVDESSCGGPNSPVGISFLL